MDYQLHINKHRDVETFNFRYPMSEEPVARDEKWVEEILRHPCSGPYRSLYDRFNRWCIHCRIEFPVLYALTQHNCDNKGETS